MAISRNLVGRESVAWVQIPPSPPEKAPTEPRVRSGLFPFWRRGCFAKPRRHLGAARGEVARFAKQIEQFRQQDASFCISLSIEMA